MDHLSKLLTPEEKIKNNFTEPVKIRPRIVESATKSRKPLVATVTFRQIMDDESIGTESRMHTLQAHSQRATSHHLLPPIQQPSI
jgi:hypothetical protein